MPRLRVNYRCTIPGCSGPAKAKKLCWRHYQQQRRKAKKEQAHVPQAPTKQ